MNTAAFALLLLAASASVIGTLGMLKAMRSAPEGFEDADGFHLGHAEGEMATRPAPARAMAHVAA